MTEKVDINFNFGGSWVISPKILYKKKLLRTWNDFDCQLLNFEDLSGEFTSKLGFIEVSQLVCLSPSGMYFTIEGDDSVESLKSLISEKFKVLDLFAVDEYEVPLLLPDITILTAPNNVGVEVGSDCEGSLCKDDEKSGEEYNSDELESFRQEKRREVGDKLENFKELEKGMTFKDLQEARRIVNFYALANKKKIKVYKSDKTRSIYKCEEGCPFSCHISRDGKSFGFKIKTLNSTHDCDDCFKNPRAQASTLAYFFKNKLQGDPKYKVKEMRGELEVDLKLNVNNSKLKRAKGLALDKLEGSFLDDYNRLEAYAQELKLSNPGSDIVINISKDALEMGKRKFLRMYICFQALKDGWKSGLRPLIGLDGTFLKGKCLGQLLVAVAQDSMNSFYPLAWAVVDKETISTWTWFLEHLKNSLELGDGIGVTFISDMQKGLLKAVKCVLPEANQRWCVRHIEANWCKKWRSGQMKKMLWWSSWSTYNEEFKDQLKKLGKLSEESARDLVKYPPQYWCRAFFDTRCKNLMVDNNFTESFNAWVLEAREKPIIKMLEEIRVKVMNMLARHDEKIRSWKSDISPQCMKLYKDFRDIAHQCRIEFNGDCGYEVSEGEDRHTVDLEQKKFTCRTWDLSGIPCPHAIRALMHQKINPISEIHWFYSLEAYSLIYKHKLKPVRGQNFWKIEPFQAMEPPEIVKRVGRPRTKRTKVPDEAIKRKGGWGVSRRDSVISCSNCGGENHNTRTCTLSSDVGQSQEAPGQSQQREEPDAMEWQELEVATQQSEFDFVTQQSEFDGNDETQEAGYDTQEVAYGDVGFDEDPTIRPNVVSESQVRLEARKNQGVPTGTRKIGFTGDAFGVSIPTDLPYSPTKLLWKGKATVTTEQLQGQARQKRAKQMARKGKRVAAAT